MKAEQVLDMQGDLLRRLNEEPQFQEAVVNLLTMSGGRKLTRAEHARNARVMVARLGVHLKAAYAYRVTPDMSLLVQHAADMLDESDRCDRDLAPTGCGAVRFDRPLPIMDARGTQMKAHWLTWGPIEVTKSATDTNAVTGTFCSWWNDMNDPDEASLRVMNDPELRAAGVLASTGRWNMIGGDVIYQDMEVGPALTMTPLDRRAQLLAEGAQPVEGSTNTQRYVHALWLMLNQTVTSTEEEHVRKTARRLAVSRGLPARVSVIGLRRTEGGARRENETTVDWAHRWVVRGHWRWQPYGEGRKERRRIWINPFVKGPADKPLVVPDKIYDLRR